MTCFHRWFANENISDFLLLTFTINHKFLLFFSFYPTFYQQPFWRSLSYSYVCGDVIQSYRFVVLFRFLFTRRSFDKNKRHVPWEKVELGGCAVGRRTMWEDGRCVARCYVRHAAGFAGRDIVAVRPSYCRRRRPTTAASRPLRPRATVSLTSGRVPTGPDRAGPGWADGPSIPVAVNAQPRSLPARDPDCCVVPCRSWRAVVFRPQTWRCAAPRRSIFANVASMSLVHLKASREDTYVRRLLSTCR